jgi:Protein of unknown function (DUF2530)
VVEVSSTRRPAPPPLEANDQLVTVVITAAWAVALVILLALRTELPPGSRWWIWTCAFGTATGLFGIWYIPRLQRSRARVAKRRAEARAAAGSLGATAAAPKPDPAASPGPDPAVAPGPDPAAAPGPDPAASPRPEPADGPGPDPAGQAQL